MHRGTQNCQNGFFQIKIFFPVKRCSTENISNFILNYLLKLYIYIHTFLTLNTEKENNLEVNLIVAVFIQILFLSIKVPSLFKINSSLPGKKKNILESHAIEK